MKDPKLRLFLFRHGETEWAKVGKHTGMRDLDLTETGRRQALDLGQMLAGRPFRKVLVSPLLRARETCRLAGYESQAQVVPWLHEWNYGAYEGRTSEEIRSEIPGWNIWTHGVRGGELVSHVAARAHDTLALARQTDGDVAIFAHGHLLRILTASWLNLPPEAGRLFALQPARACILGHENTTRVIRLWNATVLPD